MTARTLALTTVTPQIMLEAGRLDWTNRDPFDRLVVATARMMGLPVVSSDKAFASAPGVAVIW